MKTTTIVSIAFASVLSYGLFATASQPSEANCSKLGEIRAGNQFNKLSETVATESVKEEAKKLGADKVTMKVVSHKHPKLGTQYTAYAVAWKCDK